MSSKITTFSYVSDKFFEISNNMKNQITNICTSIRYMPDLFLFHSSMGPCRFRSLAIPADQGFMGSLAPPCSTAMRRSSVAATNRPPRRGLPLLKCHSHWFTSPVDVASPVARRVGCTRGLVDLGVRILRGGYLPFSLELVSLILGLSVPNLAYM